jgi:hypothetical protein
MRVLKDLSGSAPCNAIFEAKNAWCWPTPGTVTAVDKSRGMHWKGTSVSYAAEQRFYSKGTGWTEWKRSSNRQKNVNNTSVDEIATLDIVEQQEKWRVTGPTGLARAKNLGCDYYMKLAQSSR